MTQLKSQISGLLLALATAIGCIFYEKLVHNFSYLTVATVMIIEAMLLFVIGIFIFPVEIRQDYQKFISDSRYWIWAGAYMLTGVTSLFWYIITRDQGIMVGSIYEVKYIIMMALLYIIFGDRQFTIYTGIGLLLALGSMYFISKN